MKLVQWQEQKRIEKWKEGSCGYYGQIRRSFSNTSSAAEAKQQDYHFEDDCEEKGHVDCRVAAANAELL